MNMGSRDIIYTPQVRQLLEHMQMKQIVLECTCGEIIYASNIEVLLKKGFDLGWSVLLNNTINCIHKRK